MLYLTLMSNILMLIFIFNVHGGLYVVVKALSLEKYLSCYGKVKFGIEQTVSQPYFGQVWG
jgi:hypothetical protein